MRIKVGFILSLFVGAQIISQSPAFSADIPVEVGWTIAEQGSGDLNGDGVADVAAILTKKTAGDEDAAQATLKIYFGGKTGVYSLATEAKKAVCVNCGGIKGGEMPYEVSIGNGVISLRYQGGSRETSDETTKWRYQNGDFYLIGISEVDMDTIASTKGAIFSIKRDVNVSTLNEVETVTTVLTDAKDGVVEMPPTKVTEKKCKVPAALKKMKLKDFGNTDFETPGCSKVSI